MSNTTTEDLKPILMAAISPEIRRLLGESTNVFGKFRAEPDKHPWLTSLEALAKMLAGEIDIPHGVSQITTSSGKRYTTPSRTHRPMVGDYYPKGSYVNRITKIESSCSANVCNACHDAFIRREAYNKVLMEEKQ